MLQRCAVMMAMRNWGMKPIINIYILRGTRFVTPPICDLSILFYEPIGSTPAKMKTRSTKDIEHEKQQLVQALDEMRAHASDAQCVYTCLVQMHDILDGHQQVHVLVNSVVSPAATVKLLQEVFHLHLHQEEIQWYWCRFLVITCKASLRFQCQAGRLELWSDVYEIRSTHPSSMRVSETSLLVYEALLNSNEYHVLKARPAQKMIQDMLHTIDRFAYTSELPSQSCQKDRPEMVILAMRVLASMYSSSRLVSLVEEKESTFADAIVSRMVSTFALFLERRCDTKLWLRMCRLQVQQHGSTATLGLFFPKPASASPTEQSKQQTRPAVASWKPWFVHIVEKHGADAGIMYDYFALFTHLFALPHKLGSDLDVLTRELLENHNLLGTFCDVLGKYHEKQTTETANHTPGAEGTSENQLTLLEILRVIRQWSSIGTMLMRFPKAPQVQTALIPALIAFLQRCTVPTKRNLQFALDTLLIFQQLGSIASYKNMLSASTPFQSAIHQLRKTLLGSGGSSDDSDLDALVKRELKKAASLLVPPLQLQQHSSKTSQLVSKPTVKAITSAQQSSRQKSGNSVRPPPMRLSTREQSSTAVAITLRASASSHRL